MADALEGRARGLARLPRRLRNPPRAGGRARVERIGRAAGCSLVQPTGPRRRVAAASVDLGAIRATAHLRGATVNDALVSAIAGALHNLLESRGEIPPPVVMAVPVAVRRGATAADPGNAFTEARARVSGGGDPGRRLADVGTHMRQRKDAAMQPMTLLVAAPAVRAMVASGVYDWYMRRQHYLHTVLTNLRGPDQRVALGGAPIARMLPLAVGGGGNVAVTFAALSYAGTLEVTVTVDPDVTPDLPLLVTDMQAQLDTLATDLGGPPPRRSTPDTESGAARPAGTAPERRPPTRISL